MPRLKVVDDAEHEGGADHADLRAYCRWRLWRAHHRSKQQRKPTLGRLVKQARKLGATSVVTPEGYTLRFDEAAKLDKYGDDALDNWIAKHAH
jgi:hypothetical protein